MKKRKAVLGGAGFWWFGIFFGGAAALLGGGGAPMAQAANVYAQYDGSAVIGGNGESIRADDILGLGNVQYLQVMLNIKNDPQNGASYYCPVAPNTGVVIFLHRGGPLAYTHCVTSAEAEGKLGKKAVYTFDDASFGFGSVADAVGNQRIWLDIQGADEVYGTQDEEGALYPYLVFADAGGVGSPAVISGLLQRSEGATSTLPENGLAEGNALALSGTPSSFFASDTVQLQVEVRPADIPFSGVPTGMSGEGVSGETAEVTVDRLKPGAYHWAARAVDVTGNYFSPWAEYRAAGNIDFHIASATAREPVVIVPGIMGSRLKNASTGAEVWPNAPKMVREKTDSYLDYLKMDEDGTPSGDRPVEVGDLLRAATTTFLGVPFRADLYSKLIEGLTDEGYKEGSDLFIAPYDWRIGVESSTAALSEVIDRAVEASGSGKIIVIAHSMGGLLMKNYLLTHPSPDFLDKLVLVGVPQLGAPKAYKLLNYGDDMGLSWLGFGLNQDEARELAANMPSIYELLPSRRYLEIAGSYVQDFRGAGSNFLSYDDIGGPNPGLSVAADLFHRGMDALPVNAQNVYSIVGCLTPTAVEYHLYDDGVLDIKRAAGDGTVPEVSAMNLADRFHNYFVLGNETGIDHLGLVQDARPLALIKNILAGVNAALPAGISASLGDCVTPRVPGAANATTVEFSAHHGTLDVYDPAGNHTGLTADGAIELGIPGSSFEKIGENIFVLAPELQPGGSYAVVDRATASGTASMKVREYDAGTLVQSATYLSVPFAGASATAELSYAGFGGDMALAVDQNGDGVHDLSMAPDAVLATASSADDFAPPELTLPQIPAQVLRGSTTTLSFGAADAGSGVASIEASLNGESVTSSDTVIFSKEGENIFALTATDRAGNTRSERIVFTVSVPPPVPPADNGSDNGGSGAVGNSTGGAAGASGNGGGGGGGSSPAESPHVSTTTIPAAGQVLGASTTASLPDLLMQLAKLKKQLVGLEVRAAGVCPIAIEEDLHQGMDGPAVTGLQKILNGSTLLRIADDGPGSPGYETAYFGSATTRAVKAFQNIFADQILAPLGLTDGTGYVGAATRHVLEGVCNANTSNQ